MHRNEASQLSEFDLDAVPTASALKRQLSRMSESADLKALFADVAEVTVKVGNRVLPIGRAVLGFALNLIRAFPTLVFGVVVAIVLSLLVAAIPFVGPVLSAFLTPLLLLLGIGGGALVEMVSGDLGQRVSGFVDSVQTLFGSEIA